MAAKDALTNRACLQGWSLDTQIDLLCQFIDRAQLATNLNKFLGRQATEENSFSLDNETE